MKAQRRRKPRPARAVIRPELRALARAIADAFWGGCDPDEVVTSVPAIEPLKRR